MNKLAFAVLATLAVFGCGGEASETAVDAGPGYDTQTFTFGSPGAVSRPATPEEAQEMRSVTANQDEAGPAPEGDYGQTSEALSIPMGEYGSQHLSGGPCVSQNTQNDYCGVPKDKFISYHWSGPTTDSNFPTLNFKTILQEAVAELNGLGTTFAFDNGSSTSAEGMALSNNTCGTGSCGLGETSVFYVVPAKQVSPGFWVARQNKCDTRISLNVAIQQGWSGLSSSTQHFRFKRLFEHEMGHCAGWVDFYDSGHQGVFLMYGFFMNTPPTFSPLEVQLMQMFQP